MSRQHTILSIVFVMWSALATPTMAKNYFWTATNGTWEAAANWTPSGGPPRTGDIAFVSGTPNGPVDVALSADEIGSKSPTYLSVSNNSALNLQGHRLNIAGNAFLGQDGRIDVKMTANGAGVIGFDSDELQIDGGTLRVFPGAYVRSGATELDHGAITFNGGSRIQSTTQTSIGNSVGIDDAQLFVVGAGQAVLSGPAAFHPDARILIESGTSLRLDGPTYIQNGAEFDGPGELVNSAGNLLKLGSTPFAIDLINEGDLYAADQGKDMHVRALTTTNQGVLHLSLNGTDPSQYETLRADVGVELQGAIVIAINSGAGTYMEPTNPGQFDLFQLVEAPSVSLNLPSELHYGGNVFPLTAQDVLSSRFHAASGLFHNLEYGVGSIALMNYRAFAGDADGDSLFDSSDLVRVFAAGTYESQIVGNATWTEGDWNDDGLFDSSDLIAAFQTGKYFGGQPSVSAVPEPSSWALCLAAIPLACRVRMATRRRV